MKNELGQAHADRVIAAAQHLEAAARRMKDHAKAIRANAKTGQTHTGKPYTQAEIDNFEDWQIVHVRNAADRAAVLVKGGE